MTKADSGVGDQESLVAEQRQVGGGCRRTRHHLADQGARLLACGRFPRRRRSEQARDADRDQADRDGQAGAQEARGVAVELELPPQLG